MAIIMTLACFGRALGSSPGTTGISTMSLWLWENLALGNSSGILGGIPPSPDSSSIKGSSWRDEDLFYFSFRKTILPAYVCTWAWQGSQETYKGPRLDRKVSVQSPPPSIFVLYTVIMMAEEKNPQLFHVSLPPKFPLGLFPKPIQPYLELIRLDKVYIVNS